MKLRFQQIVLSWLLVLAIGGHWPVLQSVAWVKMLVKFSQTDDFKTALEKTFSGKHPCNLCSLVAKGKATEQKQSAQTPTAKLELFLVKADSFVPRIPRFIEPEFLASVLSEPLFSPASPPPKTA